MIEDAITDTNREKAATILHPGIVQEFKVFVEGKIDHRMMKVMFPEITVQRVGLKKQVIERVKHQKNTIGVVDTDSDFYHQEIIESERCIDTGSLCCMFAGVFDYLPISEIFVDLRKMINRKFMHQQDKIIHDTNAYLDNIVELINVTTETRLFRNWRSKSTDSRVKYNNENYSICWSNILDFMEKIQDRTLSDVSDDNIQEYLLFREEFKHELSNCGVNDHSFEDVVVGLVRDEYDKKAKISRNLMRNMIRKKYELTISNHSEDIIKNFNEIYNFVLKSKLDFESNRQE